MVAGGAEVALCGAAGETLANAEESAAHTAAELQRAQERNDELARRCVVEEDRRAALAQQLIEVEAAAAAAREREEALLERTQAAADERAALEERLRGARIELEDSRSAATSHEAELASQREAVGMLREQVAALEGQLAAEREATALRESEAAALAQTNLDLEQRVAKAKEGAMAKDQLVLLRHKLYCSKRRPSSAGSAAPSSGHVGARTAAPRPVSAGIHRDCPVAQPIDHDPGAEAVAELEAESRDEWVVGETSRTPREL